MMDFENLTNNQIKFLKANPMHNDFSAVDHLFEPLIVLALVFLGDRIIFNNN